MKIRHLLLIVLGLCLLACAPASAPIATEIPATEAPASTEEPLPEVSKVTFVFEYNYVPESWINKPLNSETITFYSDGKDWNTVALTPTFQDKGPLFSIQLDPFVRKSGNCPVDTYHSVNQAGDQQFLARPLCHTPSDEESLLVSVRLPNCSHLSALKLYCTYETRIGILQYTLNYDQDVFEYQYIGAWDLEFEYALNNSLTRLGFTPPSEEFYRSSVENKIYTVQKGK